MRSRGTCAFPARVEAVRRRFERWRQTREGRSRIPDPLWNSAVKLSATYGIHRTAKTLRLNPDSLKKHVASATDNGPREEKSNGNGSRGQGESRQKGAGQKAATTFVEWVPPDGIHTTECIVELENVHGTKMRIQVTGNQVPAVVTAVGRVLFGATP